MVTKSRTRQAKFDPEKDPENYTTERSKLSYQAHDADNIFPPFWFRK